jgi:hypothetical protein
MLLVDDLSSYDYSAAQVLRAAYQSNDQLALPGRGLRLLTVWRAALGPTAV